MFKQLSPRGVILPLNYRNTVPGPSSVLTHVSPWALHISWEWESLFIWSSRKGVGLGARMGLFWRVFRALQDLGQSNTSLSTDIYFIIFKAIVHPNLAAKKSMWKQKNNIWKYLIALWFIRDKPKLPLKLRDYWILALRSHHNQQWATFKEFPEAFSSSVTSPEVKISSCNDLKITNW